MREVAMATGTSYRTPGEAVARALNDTGTFDEPA
jgi:hypothetical protein